MNDQTDTQTLGEAGMKALQAGDPARARALFDQILARGERDSAVLLAAAMARRGMRDFEAAHSALDEVLRADQQNLQAYLMKADCYHDAGDKRAAMNCYNIVLKLSPPLEQLPPAVAEEIRRAQSVYDRLSGDTLRHIDQALAKAGYDRKNASRRFTDSLDILAGRKKRYIEQPRSYFFPGLPDDPFYPRERFDWLGRLEAASDDIASELAAVVSDERAFAPYIHAEANRPLRTDHALLDSKAWSALFLWRDGEPVQENLARFPKTIAVLESLPLEDIPGKAPMALFSRLEPGARIEPHCGFLNSRLICHLPLVAPGGSYLRVGNETREWVRGRAWVFNDTIEHEAWNESGETRIVLIFSIWRPELDAAERKLVSALLQSVETLA